MLGTGTFTNNNIDCWDNEQRRASVGFNENEGLIDNYNDEVYESIEEEIIIS